MTTDARRTGLLALLTLAAVGLVLSLPAIPQWPEYHAFADRRAWLGVPNFLDAASNLAFVAVAAAGLRRLLFAAPPRFVDPREGWPYRVFFAALLFTGFASAWYHLAPDTPRLVWDRLGMSALFMAWLAAQIAERIGVRLGLALLPVLLALGAAAVLAWGASEARGAGDLRAYALVHFYPALLIPVLLWLFPPRYTRGGDVLVVLGLYAAALVAEFLDARIFALGEVVSGHTLKHLIAAFAAWRVLTMLERRQSIATTREAETRHDQAAN